MPCSLYSDRGSHYFTTPVAGGKVAKHDLTQVGRALAQPGIKHIPAYSPQARGRSERMFGTLQGRLVRELADAGIEDMGEANRFLRDIYLPDHNRRFSEPAAEEEAAFVPVVGIELGDILCHQEERVVGNDNTVRFQGLVLQILPSPWRPHFAKAKVRVHRYPMASWLSFTALGSLAATIRGANPSGRSTTAPPDTAPGSATIRGACPRIKNRTSGQLTCYKTGQLDLLPTTTEIWE